MTLKQIIDWEFLAYMIRAHAKPEEVAEKLAQAKAEFLIEIGERETFLELSRELKPAASDH